MTKIPPGDILEGLYKLRIRESEKLKTVLELYDLEIHQKKLGLDYHRLKTMVKRSIEQDIRNRNFGIRNRTYEKNAVVKNQGTKQRIQRILGDCWQWEANGQCVKGDNCSFRHDMNKRGKSSPSNPSPNSFMQQNERKSSRTRSSRGKSPVVECLDGLARITSKELAITHFVKSGTRQNVCSTRPRVVVGLVKSAHTHIVRLMNSRQKKSKKNGDKSAVAMLKKGDWHERGPVTDQCHDRSGKPDKRSDKKLGRKSSQSSDARQLGYVFQDMTPPKSILRKCTDMRKPIQRVKFTKGYCASH